MFIFEFDHFHWLLQFHRDWRQASKLVKFSRFLLRSEYPIQVKISKWLKLLNSVPFIKKPLVNQVCIWIWSFWLTFTVLQWIKKKSKNSQFSILSAKVRVCDFVQNLKMAKTSQFCSIHQETTCKSSLHSNLIILTDFHSFTRNEGKHQN